MLRPQNGNLGVSFNNTLLNFGLCSMDTVQQNGRFTLFSSKFPSNIYSILFDQITQFRIRQDTDQLNLFSTA